MRHIHRGAFVAHIDDAYALGVRAHPNRHDVAAAQAEDAIDAACFEETRNHTRSRVHAEWGGCHRTASRACVCFFK